MNDNLTPDLQIAAYKQKGMKNKDIAALVYPDLPIESAVVKVSRHLTKGQAGAYLEQTKTIALKKYNMTWDRIMRKIDDKLDATKSDFHTGAEIDDNPTQMAALSKLINLMDTKRPDEPNAAALDNIPSNFDEIQILKAWKNPPPNS